MSETKLKPQAMDATTRLASKTITITRDGTAVGADVSYTGIGFMPTSMKVEFLVDATLYNGRGQVDSAKTCACVYQYAANLYSAGDTFICYSDKFNWAQSCIVATFDADGFKLTWTKAGSPTAGTIIARIICYR